MESYRDRIASGVYYRNHINGLYSTLFALGVPTMEFDYAFKRKLIDDGFFASNGWELR